MNNSLLLTEEKVITFFIVMHLELNFQLQRMKLKIELISCKIQTIQLLFIQ